METKRVIKISELQCDILTLMRSKDTFSNPLWGFSAMGFREVANEMGLKPTQASNAMRAMMNKGIFFDATSKDQWDDTTYYLANTEYKDYPEHTYILFN